MFGGGVKAVGVEDSGLLSHKSFDEDEVGTVQVLNSSGEGNFKSPFHASNNK